MLKEKENRIVDVPCDIMDNSTKQKSVLQEKMGNKELVHIFAN